MELPSRSARVNVLENLWHKTNDILVIVEHGKKGGYAAVMEARDLILELTGHKVTETFKVDSSQRGVISGDSESIPCSHTMAPVSIPVERKFHKFSSFFLILVSP